MTLFFFFLFFPLPLFFTCHLQIFKTLAQLDPRESIQSSSAIAYMYPMLDYMYVIVYNYITILLPTYICTVGTYVVNNQYRPYIYTLHSGSEPLSVPSSQPASQPGPPQGMRSWGSEQPGCWHVMHSKWKVNP